MALALIQFKGRDGNDLLFQCNIGTNRYYEYAIGDNARMEYQGLELLAGVVYQSELQELGGALRAMGRFELRVPAGRFHPGTDFLQLYSYKSPDRRGQAASEIVQFSVRSGSDTSDLVVPGLSRSTSRQADRVKGAVNVRHRVVRKSLASGLSAVHRRFPGSPVRAKSLPETPPPASNYVFDRLAEAPTTPIALNDPVKYRDFWHKVWAGKAPEHSSVVQFEARYVFAADEKLPQNGRLETTLQRDDVWSDEEREVYDLESGMLLAYPGLNRLLAALEKPALPEAAQRALSGTGFAGFLGSEASATLRFDGLQGGEILAIWAFPEVSLHRLWFRKSGGGNLPNTAGAESFEFPVPVFLRLIGVKSEDGSGQAGLAERGQIPSAVRNGQEQLRIDGMVVAFDRRIALLPAEYDVYRENHTSHEKAN